MEDLIIDGRMEGTIQLQEHRLTVGPEAHVLADIRADSVTVFGKVTGNITAIGVVDIRGTGSVEGEVTCGRLAVAEGALLRGRLQTRDKREDANSATRRPDLATV
jgi:cytoskeletal protein CcmA (bactofilin family)